MYLDHFRTDVHQPILLEARNGIQRPFDEPVFAQRRIGHFDHQVRSVRMRLIVVAARHDRDVRLRLGLIRSDEGKLNPDGRPPRKAEDQ